MCDILVVDDEARHRESLAGLIRGSFPGCNVACAADGEHALQYIAEHAADIVISDIQMPNMNGLELIERLSTQQGVRKVIVLTGYAYFEYARHALRYGACEYILKPFDKDDLFAAIRKAAESLESGRRLKEEADPEFEERAALCRKQLGEAFAEADECKAAECIGRFADGLAGRMELGAMKDMLSALLREQLAKAAAARPSPDPAPDRRAADIAASLDGCADAAELVKRAKSGAARAIRLLSDKRNGRNESIIQACRAYIRTHYGEELSLESVATRFYFNPSYFSTFFKQHTGMSLSEYIQSVRLREARSMLLASAEKVQDVAARTGYKDTGHFIKQFKREFGLTPAEYRRLLGSE